MRLLATRDFRLLFTGQALSLIGSGMVNVAVSFAVLDLTGSVADVGLVLATRTAVLAVVLLPGGIVADRFSRRRVMVGADLVAAAGQAVLAALLISGEARVWEVAALLAVSGGAQALFLPAVTGLTSEIVGPDRWREANALRSLAGSAGYVAGPAVAGVLVATVGPGWALAVDAGSYGASAICLTLLRVDARPVESERRVLHELAEGWRAYRSRAWLLIANVHAALMNMIVLGAFVVLGPAVARRDLGGARAWGVIVALYGVGLVLGGIVAMRHDPRRRMLVGLVLGAVFAPLLGLLAVGAPTWLIAVAAVPAGMQLTLLNTFWETTLQEQIPPSVLARVTSIDWLSSVATAPLGYVLVGLAGSALGVPATLWIAAGVAVAASAAVGLSRSVREVGG